MIPVDIIGKYQTNGICQAMVEVASANSSILSLNRSLLYDPVPLEIESSDDEIIASERKNKLK